MDTERFGERERAVVARAQSEALKVRAEALRERALLQSDRTVQMLRRDSGRAFGEQDGGLSFRLPRLPIVLGLVRHELRRWLEREGVAPEPAADVTLACSEVCANAMEHPRASARPAFEVTVRLRDGRVEIVVKDFGRWNADVGAEGDWRGRGLDMVRQLMDEVEIAHGALGTRVTMRRRVDVVGA